MPFCVALIGPSPTTAGSTPATPKDSMLARILSPNFLAFSSFISKSIAAPSLTPGAFPAVTLPPYLKAGLMLLIFLW